MALGGTVYNALFKRTSTFVLTVIVAGVLFERIYDSWADSTWERMNRGVCCLLVFGIATKMKKTAAVTNLHILYSPYTLYSLNTETVEGYQGQV